MKTIYLAAGCFWGAQAFFDQAKGVISTRVAYLNGGFEGVSYKQVCQNSGHVEVVEINYDLKEISSETIWNLFLKIVDPYSLNKQGGDKGIQYRCGVYAKNQEDLNIFLEFNKKFVDSERRDNVLEFDLVKDLTIAEEYHQKYLEKNPQGYCHVNLSSFPEDLKKNNKIKAFITELKKRNIIKDISDEEKFINIKKGQKIYIGFDPTAQSLHLGNYIAISVLKRFQKLGIETIAIVGGATGMIGDPSFASKERVLLDSKTLLANKAKIIKQLESFGLEVFDNFQIYQEMTVIDFLRDIGKTINIAYLLAKDSIATRIQSGLSFTEFSYQLIQGWDFKYLYENLNVVGQGGGSDQWGNMVTGLDIIKKTIGETNSFVFTTNLLTDEQGRKFGKTFGGEPMWLDGQMFSPYKLYQFLYNQSDEQAEKIMMMLSFSSLNDIKNLISEHNLNKKARLLQKRVSEEIVFDIHGQKGLDLAHKISNILFGKISYEMINQEEKTELTKVLPFFQVKEFNIDVMLESKIFSSKRELREFISDNALEINGVKIQKNEDLSLDLLDEQNRLLIKKGKKSFFIIEVAK